jgi:glycerophosphoryl diester phosphodiesterase
MKQTRNRLAAMLALAIAVSCGCILLRSAERPIKIVAHRGANKFAPENTIPAIEKAIAMGLDYVEIDVRETKDGEFVLMHNASAGVATDGNGAVADMTLAEIKMLDAGIKRGPRFKGVRVPTLREAFAVMTGKIGAYVDFKAGSPEKLVKIMREYDMQKSSVVYGGFDELLALVKLDPEIVIMPGADNAAQLKLMLKSVKLKAVETSVDAVSNDLMDEARADGVMVFMDILGFSDNRHGMEKAIGLSPYAIQTDNPDLLLKVFNKKEKKE